MASNIMESYTVKMEVPENGRNEFDITLEDFPFICRVCFVRGDLRLFEEEDCMWDLFLKLTKIEKDHLSGDFPRNVCGSCISKLEDISLFIDISKYNHAIFLEKIFSISLEERTVRIREDEIEKKRSTYCRGCLCTNNLSPFEEKATLLQLFQKCTEIDVRSYSGEMNSICDKCTDELQKASLFISLSLRNNEILQTLTAVVIKEGMLDADMDIHANIIINEDIFEDSSNMSFGSFIEADADLHTSINIKQEDSDDTFIADLHTSINIKQEDDTFILSASPTFRSEVVSFGQTKDKSSETFLGQNEGPMRTDPQKLSGHISEKILQVPSKQSLKCNNCDKSFYTNFFLQRHVLIHTGEKPHTCEHCGKKFSMESNLKRHLLICTERLPMQKGNMLQHSNILERHSLAQAEENPFKCESCDYSSKWKHNLERHSLNCTTRKNEKPFRCNSCVYSSKWKHNLERHSLNCNKLNSAQEDTSTHGGENSFKCDICEKKFSQNFFLKQHLLTHAEEEEESPFKCKSCDYSSKWKHNLERHMLRTHRKRKASTRCKKWFGREYYSKRQSKDGPNKCDGCGFSTMRQHSLRRHLLTCSEICSTEKRNMQQPSTTYKTKRAFKCTMCEKTFRALFRLKRHLPTHSEERPYKCKGCDFSTKWGHSLQRHRMVCSERTHGVYMQKPLTVNIEKGVKCPMCKKSFRDIYCLQMHSVTHI